jgi:hypothetical protein
LEGSRLIDISFFEGGKENVIRTQTKFKGPSAQIGKTAELSLTLQERKNAWLKSNSISPKKGSGTIRKTPNPSSKSGPSSQIKLKSLTNWLPI